MNTATIDHTDTRLPLDARRPGLHLVIRPTADAPRGQTLPAAFGIVSQHTTRAAAETALDAQYDGARAQGGYCRDMIVVTE